jgi:hypothetical protein
MDPFVQPNLWVISGNGVQVRYFSGGPNLWYQDALRLVSFSGDEVRVVEHPDIGTLVSVTIFITVDSGSTSFTMLLPRVNLPPAALSSAPVSIVGISTAHHFSLIPSFSNGQQDYYGTVLLDGTAWNFSL